MYFQNSPGQFEIFPTVARSSSKSKDPDANQMSFSPVSIVVIATKLVAELKGP